MPGYALAKHLAKGGKEIEHGSEALGGVGLADDGLSHPWPRSLPPVTIPMAKKG